MKKVFGIAALLALAACNKIETGQRIDTLTVPFLAIRETVLNMLAHRSWWDEDESLSVAIFDDRIEFTNPGHFPINKQ